MKAIQCILLILLITTFGCKKKKYPTTVNTVDTIFYIKLLVDGQPVRIDAGKNNYYMSSYISKSASNVYSLDGEFKQSGCTNCPNSIRLQIFDSKISNTSNSIDVNTVLQIKKYGFVLNADSLLSKVNVSYTDVNGTTYTSTNLSQPLASALEVISLEEYTSDLYNKPIKKVKLNFKCTLYHGTKSMLFEAQEMVIGLAY
jgi:hypothetical protein